MKSSKGGTEHIRTLKLTSANVKSYSKRRVCRHFAFEFQIQLPISACTTAHSIYGDLHMGSAEIAKPHTYQNGPYSGLLSFGGGLEKLNERIESKQPKRSEQQEVVHEVGATERLGLNLKLKGEASTKQV